MKHFPACFVELPAGSEGRRAAFYLAAEEWIVRNLPLDSYLFTWQLSPTVVMGRNQIAHQEVDIDFCRRNGIDIIRRRSGGGAIFADEGNIMISLITSGGKVEPLFAEYAETVAEGLRSLGANAEVHGRNDIILMGKGKVCGNAFYHMSNRNIVHGTMLYSTNPAMMQGALRPMPEKLHAKGIQSVRARVGMLEDAHLDLGNGGVGELRKALRLLLTNRSISLDKNVLCEVEEIEQCYYDEDFLYGSSSRDEEVRGGRVEGCGDIEIHFGLKGSIIRKVWLSGDFFETSDAQKAFSEALVGVTFSEESIAEAIQKHHTASSIRNLSDEDLMRIIYKK